MQTSRSPVQYSPHSPALVVVPEAGNGLVIYVMILEVLLMLKNVVPNMCVYVHAEERI